MTAACVGRVHPMAAVASRRILVRIAEAEDEIIQRISHGWVYEVW